MDEPPNGFSPAGKPISKPEFLDRGEGCNTPAEEFLEHILMQLPNGLTPEHVQMWLLEFEENFTDVKNNCRYAHRFYPEMAAQAAEEARAAS